MLRLQELTMKEFYQSIRDNKKKESLKMKERGDNLPSIGG